MTLSQKAAEMVLPDIIDQIWETYDVDNSGVLDKEQAKKFCLDMVGNLESGEAVIDEAFDEFFHTLNIDNSGSVTKDEMAIFIRQLLGPDEFPPPKKEKAVQGDVDPLTPEQQALKSIVDDVFGTYDVDLSGALDREQAKKFIQAQLEVDDLDEEDFEKVFLTMDTNKSGTVERNEMEAFIKMLNES